VGDGGEGFVGGGAPGAGRMRLHVTSHPVADRGRRLSRALTPARQLRNTWVYTEIMIYAVEPIFHRARWRGLAAQRPVTGRRRPDPSENPMA